MELASRPGNYNKPQTSQASVRPQNRTQKRLSSRGNGGPVQKRNHAIADTVNHLGTGKTKATKTSEPARSKMYRNVPISGRTSDIFNPSNNKDGGGFFVHRRSDIDVAAVPVKQRTRSNEYQKEITGERKRATSKVQQKTMEQLAREGAAQAIESGRLDSDGDLNDQNDTTAMSDQNSLQNFSYYGRRFQDAQQMQLREQSPIGSDAVSLNYGQSKNVKPTTSFGSQTSAGSRQFKMMRKATQKLQANQWTNDSHYENLQNVANKQQSRKKTANQNNTSEYIIEEKMNDNLMRQFEPMFSEDRKVRHRYSGQDGALLKSVSDFSQLNESIGPYSGSKHSQMQLFQQGKDKIPVQRSSMAKTATGWNQAQKQQRIGTGSAPRRPTASGTSNMTTKNSLNQSQFPKRNSTAAKILPPKLPPRAAMSPAINSIKANNLIASVNGAISKNGQQQVADTPLKDNIFFAGANAQNVQQKTPQTDLVYKRGARSISRRKTDQNVIGQQSQATTALLGKQRKMEVEVPQKQQKRMLMAPEVTRSVASHRSMLMSQSSSSVSSLHTAERAERYRGRCKCCSSRLGNTCAEHGEGSVSIGQRLQKLNKNVTQNGLCRKHNKLGCDHCSITSSRGSRVSSVDSGQALISRDLLKKHRIVAQKDIDQPQPKITKSMTRQFKKPNKINEVRSSVGCCEVPEVNSRIDNRVKSLPRQQASSLVAENPDKKNDVRRSIKNDGTKKLRGQLQTLNNPSSYQPSEGNLQRPSTYTVQRADSRNAKNVMNQTRDENHSSDSRNLMSECIPRRGQPNKKKRNNAETVVQSIPNFSRILSAKTSIQREDISRRMHANQNQHCDLLQNDVKLLAKEWEGDPHDPEFWKRIEQQNEIVKERKKHLVMGQDVCAKQNNLIEKQNTVFNQLRDTDDIKSDRNSMRATSMNFTKAKASLQHQLTRNVGSQQQSKTSLFTNTIQPGQEEHIYTEIDHNEMSMFQKEGSMAPSGLRMMVQNPSKGVLTDYDIADEVDYKYIGSYRHRDHSLKDRMREGNENQSCLLPTRKPSDTGVSQIFSGQTNKTKVTSLMHEVDSIQRQNHSRAIESSQLTAAFPTGHPTSEKNREDTDEGDDVEPQKPECLPTSEKKREETDEGDDVEPQKPECLTKRDNDQPAEEKDSEDADSFGDELQKSKILSHNEQDIDHIEKEKHAMRDSARKKSSRMRRKRAKMQSALDPDEDGLSERSNEDEDEKRQKEIREKTLARVLDYDEWLDAQTQKGNERQSLADAERQTRQGQLSPGDTIKIPENGLLKLSTDQQSDGPAHQRNSQTQQIVRKEESLGQVQKLQMGRTADQKDQACLATNQQKEKMSSEKLEIYKNSRPVTANHKSHTSLNHASQKSQNAQQINLKQSLSGARITADAELVSVSQPNMSSGRNNFNERRKTLDHQSDSAKKNREDAQSLMLGDISVHGKSEKGGDNGDGDSQTNMQYQSRRNEPYYESSDEMLVRMKSPNKKRRFMGVGALVDNKSRATAPGMLPSDRNGRSNAAITVMASSLKDDDLMISSSQIDINEARNMLTKTKLETNDRIKSGKLISPSAAAQDDVGNLVIKEEENSSLKSVSPLTETSRSKKSSRISASQKSYKLKSPEVIDEVNEEHFKKEVVKRQNEKGLPPKLPQTKNLKKAKQDSKEQLLELSYSRESSARPNETMSSAEQNKIVSFAKNEAANSVAKLTPDPLTQHSAAKEFTPKEDIEPQSNTKVPLGQRNQAVVDFLAYEDSEEENESAIEQGKIQRANYVPPKTAPEVNKKRQSSDETLQLLLPKNPNMTKAPSMQSVHQNQKAIHATKKPFIDMQAQIAKTPTTGMASNKKRKALQLVMQATGVSVPQCSNSIGDPSVNEQINRIDYNQSNDAMSASFYRQHDQWMMKNGGQAGQTLNSHPSSHQMQQQYSPRQNENNRHNHQAPMAEKIVAQAKQANKQLEDFRKSVQQRAQEQVPRANRNESQRHSGSYQRPQSYRNKVLKQQSSQKTLDNSIEHDKADKVKKTKKIKLRSSSRDRIETSQRTSIRQDHVISSIDSQGLTQTNKKEAFFEKHRHSIDNTVSSRKKRDSSRDGRSAAKNRLYGQETIASVLKRNPELAYEAKNSKPATLPPRRAPKKKIKKQRSLSPEPPREDPPEEPLVQSPRVLMMPAEASVPYQINAPTNLPLPMRLPEEPPSEPPAFVLPNLCCPVDPDTPYNFDIEPREEELHFSPIEPLTLHKPLEPEYPPYQERMIKINVEEYMCEKLEECTEQLQKCPEPNHDDERILPYPQRDLPLILPPAVPNKKEPSTMILPQEPQEDEDCEFFERQPDTEEPNQHYMQPKKPKPRRK